MKFKYILFVILFSVNLNAQSDSLSHEQIAFDYFMTEILKAYEKIDYLVFDGNLETTSAKPYSFCIKLEEGDSFEEQNELKKLNINNRLIIPKLGFFKKLFVSSKKVANLYVFKSYPKDENVVVVINISNKNINDFYSILVDRKKNAVIYNCKKTYYQ